MQQSLSQYLAAALLNGTRKQFSTLHADYLEQEKEHPMSTPTSESLNGDKLLGQQPRVAIDRGASTSSLQADGSKLAADSTSTTEPFQPRPIVVKQVDHNALVGSNQGDHRQPQTAGDVTAPFRNQAGPRGETGTKGA